MANNLKIPVLNLQEQYRRIGPEIEEAVLKVLRSGHYILGENCTKLEAQVAEICGAKHGISVANGTDALHLALWSLDVGPGDEVITTPFTFAATVGAIVLRGAKPVFVDVEEETFNIDVRQIEKMITPKTKAILPVHLYGLPSNMDAIMGLASKYNLKVVEDNAQAIGARDKGRPTGSMGDAACISFYPTKNLGAAGDAGMIVTNDDKLAERLRALRVYGMRKRYYHDEMGWNSRLDEMQAAVLLTKMPYLPLWNAGRQFVAELYEKALRHCPGLVLPKIPSYSSNMNDASTVHVWHQYTIRVQDVALKTSVEDLRPARDIVIEKLAERGIGAMIYYPVPLHLQNAFAHFGYKKGDFPVTEKLSREVISLPMYPELSEIQIEEIGVALNAIMNEILPSVPASQSIVQAVAAPSSLTTSG